MIIRSAVIPLAMVLCAFSVIGYQLSQNTHLFASEKQGIDINLPTANDNLNNDIEAEDITLKPLSIAAHLFGVPVLKSTTETESLPETPLRLELRGTFASHTEGSSASALIAEANSDSLRYFIGDALPGDAELVGVEKELVIVRRNNQDEVLRLPRFGDIKQGPEMNYKDRQVFLDRNLSNDLRVNNQENRQSTDALAHSLSSDSIQEASSSSNELSLEEDNETRASLQERLSALRSRYSNN